jgi:hypothetical protein
MFEPNTDASPASENLDPNAAVPAVEGLTPDAKAAESSNADITDAKEAPTSLLDVVRDAVAKPKEPEESSTPEAEQEKPEATNGAKAEVDAESDVDVPFHTHPRWKQRTEELKALRSERDALSEPAQNFQAITGFMETHGLAPQEVAEGFEVMALLKSGKPDDLQRVLAWMEPNVAMLHQRLGKVLPDDLQTRVEDGLLDKEIAEELAQARARTSLTAEQEARRAKDAEAAKAANAAQARAEAMVHSVSEWEVRTRKADPDYAKKAALVETHARALVQQTGKPPATAEEAVALVEKAYEAVNGTFKSLLPTPRAITPAPTGMSAVVSTAPKTLAEAIRQAARRS